MAVENPGEPKPFTASTYVFSREGISTQGMEVLRHAMQTVEQNPVLASLQLRDQTVETADDFIMHPIPEPVPDVEPIALVAVAEQRRGHFPRLSSFRKLFKRNVQIPAA